VVVLSPGVNKKTESDEESRRGHAVYQVLLLADCMSLSVDGEDLECIRGGDTKLAQGDDT
jgi:hypothetical protein